MLLPEIDLSAKPFCPATLTVSLRTFVGGWDKHYGAPTSRTKPAK
jgi:hypothetical protein